MRTRMPVVRVVGWAAALVLVTAPAGAMGQGLDVRGWLDRRGVKLLAVEFYATWCKPCMAAVPKWKALHEKYRRDGLRLVVVATQDPEGACANPGWNPDDVICDNDGRIARALGANKLPAAYLWSWQGNLLVRHGHVEDVERAIEAWRASTPRAVVEVGGVGDAGIEPGVLRDLVREKIGEVNKLGLAASAGERAALDLIRAESFKARYDAALQCDLGAELPANSRLGVRVRGTARKRLSLTLMSADTGCLVTSAGVDWDAARAEAVVAEAVTELMQGLRREIQMPRSASARDAVVAEEISITATPYRPGGSEVGSGRELAPDDTGYLMLRASAKDDPAQAVEVVVDGRVVGTTDGRAEFFSISLAVGTHSLVLRTPGDLFVPRKKTFRLSPSGLDFGRIVLNPRFGDLLCDGAPAGATMIINGDPYGSGWMIKLKVSDPGELEELLDDQAYGALVG